MMEYQLINDQYDDIDLPPDIPRDIPRDHTASDMSLSRDSPRDHTDSNLDGYMEYDCHDTGEHSSDAFERQTEYH